MRRSQSGRNWKNEEEEKDLCGLSTVKNDCGVTIGAKRGEIRDFPEGAGGSGILGGLRKMKNKYDKTLYYVLVFILRFLI